MKQKFITSVLWIAFVLAMAASVQHLAWTFGTLERPGYEWLGWVPAVAVDTGLAALAYTIQQRKRAKRPVAILWAGVAGFAAVSALANLYHALAVEGVAIAAGWVVYAKAFVLSATLPVAYIFLGEIISGDDATEADKLAKQADREQNRADRIARAEEMRAERELLEAKRSEPQSKPEQITCEVCGRSFRSVNARNAHKCKPLATASEPERVNGRAK